MIYDYNLSDVAVRRYSSCLYYILIFAHTGVTCSACRPVALHYNTILYTMMYSLINYIIICIYIIYAIVCCGVPVRIKMYFNIINAPICRYAESHLYNVGVRFFFRMIYRRLNPRPKYRNSAI